MRHSISYLSRWRNEATPARLYALWRCASAIRVVVLLAVSADWANLSNRSEELASDSEGDPIVCGI